MTWGALQVTCQLSFFSKFEICSQFVVHMARTIVLAKLEFRRTFGPSTSHFCEIGVFPKVLMQHAKTFRSGKNVHTSAQNFMLIYVIQLFRIRSGVTYAGVMPFGLVERYYMFLTHSAPHSGTCPSLICF